ncbi:hypothetical protein GWI33_007006 [Rhynchophorus ferrugineus]|uniref:Uncharacterized protein n=1 Tax=Rhynchophorus ferrugineus TaxID=354439 RepID=A0A834ITP9_RHYFE|nr:hypothetical protein GWI33_007006 [Rhynchophorus ferrugineus]
MRLTFDKIRVSQSICAASTQLYPAHEQREICRVKDAGPGISEPVDIPVPISCEICPFCVVVFYENGPDSEPAPSRHTLTTTTD